MRVSLTLPTDATRIAATRTVVPAPTVTTGRAHTAKTAVPAVPAAKAQATAAPASVLPPVVATMARAQGLVDVQVWAQQSGQAAPTAHRDAVRAYPSLASDVEIIAPGMPLPRLTNDRYLDLTA